MGTDTMGRVTVAAKIESLGDLCMAQKGLLQPEDVRSIEVTDARVDPGAATLSMPKKLIEQLGLIPFRPRVARTTTGLATFQVYGAARLTIQGRDCHVDVIELPDDSPVLIGHAPLMLLDFVVDPDGRCLLGNPAHGGEQIMEMYWVQPAEARA
jgi:predicted aspartyl protease